MHLTWWAGGYWCSYAMERRSVRCNDGYIREVVGRGAGEAIVPIIWDFAPIHYLLNNKIPIYCLPLQYQFSDYLPGLHLVLQLLRRTFSYTHQVHTWTRAKFGVRMCYLIWCHCYYNGVFGKVMVGHSNITPLPFVQVWSSYYWLIVLMSEKTRGTWRTE